jgi:hypothetical protein
MKTHLMYRERDFGVELKALAAHSYRRDGEAMPKLVWNEEALTQDLELNTLFGAMACGDRFLFHVARLAVLSGLNDDSETILYRQAILKDCLRNHAVVQSLHDLAVEAIEGKRKHWLGLYGHYPGTTLYGAVQLLQMFVPLLGQLKRLADEHAPEFESEGFRIFFALLQTELADEYLTAVKAHLKALEFPDGVLVSAQLGKGNQGTGYVLRKSPRQEPGWLQRLFTRQPDAYTFRIDPRDEAGAQALTELRDRGINLAANAVAQSADHVESFFVMLRTELAFYLGCVNLHRQLSQRGVPVCFPVPAPPGARTHSCVGLHDVCLALTTNRTVVGNDLAADGKKLCIITGANKGGKSVFLRSIGLAQLMMQCGMFVAAESFSADLCRGVFTHYKREEDTEMKSGKFDEELARISDIVDALRPDSLLLFNESFAATNEREGSEVASQIVRALLETRVKIFFVTHQYEFASRFARDQSDGALFLRAERQGDGTRTFKLRPGEPLETSFGADLYARIFARRAGPVEAA